jgi:hypothetical protein
MKKIETLIRSVVVILLFLQSQNLLAQSGTISTGSQAAGPGGTVDYSIGQAICPNASGSNGTISAGLQQPFVIQSVTAIENEDIGRFYNVYPNPTSDYLILSIEKEIISSGGSYYAIFNITGELIEMGEISGQETQIRMKELESATYLVKAFLNHKVVKTFRITKN